MACPLLLLRFMGLSSAMLPKEERTPIPASFLPDGVLPSSLTLSICIYVCFTRSFSLSLTCFSLVAHLVGIEPLGNLSV
jgi:hypothetical protein